MGDDLQPSEASNGLPPLRIATVGLCPNAVFHLEAAAIREELVPVAAARTDDTEGSREPVPGCSVCDIDELVERPDVGAVFVCGPAGDRIDHAVKLLQAGKHVVIEPSSVLKTEEIQRLINEAEDNQKLCEVWRPRNADPDFRRALKVIVSDEAGPVRSIRFMQHDMAAALLPVAAPLMENAQTSRDRLTSSTLRSLTAHLVAQAMTLVSAPVKSVTAHFRRDSLVIGERDSVRNVTPEGDTSLHAIIEFENDATAILDIGLACPAPYSTGWIVQGNQGGYHTDRQYITVDDGEIYDVAVDVEPFDPYLNLHANLSNWANPAVQQEGLEQLRAELRLANVLQKFL
ncbi:MAG: putative dehydrogenase [Planctomycetaceae bacterium]|jgi:predicted dehydrogenase